MVFIEIPTTKCSCCYKNIDVPAIVISKILRNNKTECLCFCSINCYTAYLASLLNAVVVLNKNLNKLPEKEKIKLLREVNNQTKIAEEQYYYKNNKK